MRDGHHADGECTYEIDGCGCCTVEWTCGEGHVGLVEGLVDSESEVEATGGEDEEEGGEDDQGHSPGTRLSA